VGERKVTSIVYRQVPFSLPGPERKGKLHIKKNKGIKRIDRSLVKLLLGPTQTFSIEKNIYSKVLKISTRA